MMAQRKRVAGVMENGWRQLSDKLISIHSLRDDWDGEGSIAPALSTVDRATRLAGVLEALSFPPASRVTASVNGTVVFEWHTADGYLEIEVASRNDAELRWMVVEDKPCST